MGKWKLFFALRTREVREEAGFLGNLDKKATKNHFHTSDIFVNEILLIWAEVNFKDVRANCFCASLLCTQIRMPYMNARAK